MECSLWGTETTIIKVVQNQSPIKWSWTPTPIWTLLGSWACLQYFKYSIASVRLWWATKRSFSKIPRFSASVACCTVPPLQTYKSQSSLSYYAGYKLSFRTVKHDTPVWNWSPKGLSRVGERSFFGRSWLSWLEEPLLLGATNKAEYGCLSSKLFGSHSCSHLRRRGLWHCDKLTKTVRTFETFSSSNLSTHCLYTWKFSLFNVNM